jgi:hypothetical protein
MQLPDDVVIQHTHAATGDRTHRILGVPGQSKLPHDEYVERCVQSLRDLVCHWNAASRQAKDDHVVPCRVIS